ncbi:MAG: lytic transglycosylase domain-containing protein [Acidobacteriota bacterium]
MMGNQRVRFMKQGMRIAMATGFGVLLLFLEAAAGGAGSTGEIKSPYDSIIKTHARRYNVPADLIHSIIKAESNYDCRAVSPKGAVGLMQLMPETAIQYGVKDRFDPDDNIRGGVKYLKDLCKLFNSNTSMVLAAYNAGQEALKKFSGIPPYSETKEYIRRVMASYSKPFITGNSPIYKFTNSEGVRVFTNDPYYHLNSRKDHQ